MFIIVVQGCSFAFTRATLLLTHHLISSVILPPCRFRSMRGWLQDMERFMGGENWWRPLEETPALSMWFLEALRFTIINHNQICKSVHRGRRCLRCCSLYSSTEEHRDSSNLVNLSTKMQFSCQLIRSSWNEEGSWGRTKRPFINPVPDRHLLFQQV